MRDPGQAAAPASTPCLQPVPFPCYPWVSSGTASMSQDGCKEKSCAHRPHLHSPLRELLLSSPLYR